MAQEGTETTLPRRYHPGALRAAVLVLLGAATLYFLYDAVTRHGAETLAQWQARWRVLLLCLALNWAGIALDFICWFWMYRRCGVRVRGLGAPLVFLSLYAAYIVPAQAGRLARPDAAMRLGFGPMRNGIEAEAALIYLDLAGSFTLICTLAALLWSPWMAPLAAAAALAIALTGGSIASTMFHKHLAHVRPGLFLSMQGVLTALLRGTDRALLGLVLLLLIAPFAPDVPYPTAALYVLTADILGALSGLPGGAIVAEGVLASLLQWSALPQAHIAIAVTVFRVLYFWSLVPVGWAALLLTFTLRPDPENSPHG